MYDFYDFKVSLCPVCCQGWVIIVKEIESQKLSLYCQECETEWMEPIHFINRHPYSRFTIGKIEAPTREEIERQNWLHFLLTD